MTVHLARCKTLTAWPVQLARQVGARIQTKNRQRRDIDAVTDHCEHVHAKATQAAGVGWAFAICTTQHSRWLAHNKRGWAGRRRWGSGGWDRAGLWCHWRRGGQHRRAGACWNRLGLGGGACAYSPHHLKLLQFAHLPSHGRENCLACSCQLVGKQVCVHSVLPMCAGSTCCRHGQGCRALVRHTAVTWGTSRAACTSADAKHCSYHPP